MKAVILAGGYGTRLSEETQIKPKPMVEIGGMPILWHIMKIFSQHGIKDFVVCLGYKGHYIKDWFDKYLLHQSNVVTFNLKERTKKHFGGSFEDWDITLVETGDGTNTGGRLKRIKEYVGNETFMVTYGDGLADIDIKRLLAEHKEHGKAATVTAIIPKARFGTLTIEGKKVTGFREKNDNHSRINGGFFVLEPKVFDYIKDDATIFEHEPLETLAQDGHLYTYAHDGFWMPMDTLNDKHVLENLWAKGEAPWKVWDK